MTNENPALPSTHAPPPVSERRRENRCEAVRIVEYTHYPRHTRDQRLQLGVTRDFSTSGMCLSVERAEAIGALLKLTVRAVSGRCAEPVVARVAWTSAARGGRFWIGLQLLADSSRLELAA